MPDPIKLFDRIKKENFSQRDKFILYLLGMIVALVQSFMGLLAVKQLPDLVESILKAFHIL